MKFSGNADIQRTPIRNLITQATPRSSRYHEVEDWRPVRHQSTTAMQQGLSDLLHRYVR
jgi:hypothetical protein